VFEIRYRLHQFFPYCAVLYSQVSNILNCTIDRMDASQYLRRLKESQPKTLARAHAISAGQRTDMLAKAATTIFVHRKSNIRTCDTSRIAQTGSYVEPIKPAPGCLSAAMCNDFALRYTAPIVLPCAPMLYAPDSYVPQCKVQPYYGTPSQTAQAVANRTCKPSDC
jgi:hypothetical protein